MGFLDSLKKMAESKLKKEASKLVNDAASQIGKGRNHSESFTFASLPNNLAELQAMPEAKLDTAFKTAALTVAVLCRYEQDPQATLEMLDFLKGPGEVSTYEKSFFKERLEGKYYKTFAFFEGATPQNGYKPNVPYKISVIENPYSFDNENWATLWVKSGGADNPAPVKLRKKPSTGQWFLNEIQFLSDIRIPVSEDEWA